MFDAGEHRICELIRKFCFRGGVDVGISFYFPIVDRQG